MLISIRDKITSRYGKTTFSKYELSIILAAYGERVQKGQWKDYAIDCMRDVATFSIYKSSKELPLYTINKCCHKNKNKPAKYQLLMSGKVLKESEYLSDIIDFLRGGK